MIAADGMSHSHRQPRRACGRWAGWAASEGGEAAAVPNMPGRTDQDSRIDLGARRMANPTRPKPAIIIIQDAGSGTALDKDVI